MRCIKISITIDVQARTLWGNGRGAFGSGVWRLFHAEHAHTNNYAEHAHTNNKSPVV